MTVEKKRWQGQGQGQSFSVRASGRNAAEKVLLTAWEIIVC